MTYDDILSAMKSAFFEKLGRNVDAFSDLSARFECVASELYSLFCRSEFVLKQSFPQLATGEYLDYHAELFGLQRKSASRAEGTLTFSVNEFSQSDIVIPEGCICSVKGEPYIQFVTAEEGVIPAGGLSCSVNALACENGMKYNAPSGSVTVMVNPPLYVSGVTNPNAFSGGYDEESDSSLRSRLFDACSVIPTGYSAASVRELINRHDEVIDSRVHVGESLNVTVKTKSPSISQELEDYIKSCAKIAELLGMEVVITSASDVSYNLSIEAVCAVVYDDTGDKIRSAVQSYADGVKIGESVNLQQLACALSGIDEVLYAQVTSPDAINGMIFSGGDRCLMPDGVSVVCHEQRI